VSIHGSQLQLPGEAAADAVVLDEDVAFQKVYSAITSIPNVSTLLAEGISQAVDEIVDPVRSGRWRISQLDQPEKTVIGIRVENILRMALELPRAKPLDIVVAGNNVDIKFTLGKSWSIPPEAFGELCLLTNFNVSTGRVSAGLLRTTLANLNPSENRDKKKSITKKGREAIRWIIHNELPRKSVVRFLGDIAPDLRLQITDPSAGAQERLNRLFLNLKYKEIPERVVEAVAIGHVDWERRLRQDKSNAKAPEKQGFRVLRGTAPKGRARAKLLGLAPLAIGYCVAVDSF
jgi:hypothetical protein